jgi:hypothetical protein
MIRRPVMLGLLLVACAARQGRGQHHEHPHNNAANPLACSPASGEACYHAVIDDFHTINSPHPNAIGEAYFALNRERTELRYLLEIDGLNLKSSAADRTAPDDIIGVHLHLNVPDTVGPHVLNIFGLATYNMPAEEDSDLVIDFAERSLSGVYDDGDATIDPATGEPYLPFLPLTSKPLSNWLEQLDEGDLMVAVHSNASGFPAMAIHGHISRVIPEPATVVMLGGAGVFLFAGRRRHSLHLQGNKRAVWRIAPEPSASWGVAPATPCRRALLIALSICISIGAPDRLRAQPAADGEWTTAFTWGMGGGIEAVHTFLLPTGNVMFWSTWRESVGLWDPTTQQFSVPANRPGFNVFCSGHAWLPDGRLLVAGGHVENYNGEHRADIFNPFTNRWANADPNAPNVPDMGPSTINSATSGKRWYPSATTLGNGDVLVLSGDVVPTGSGGGGNTNRTAQIYEHATNSWRTLTGALRPTNDLLPEYPRVFATPDGRAVSLSDGSNDTEFLNLTGAGSWSYLQDTLDSNLHNYGPAVMYDTGMIAYIGGGHNPTRNISILDLNEASPRWRWAGGGTTRPPAGSPFAMAQPRRQNNATILADGTVLITGGTSVTGWNDPSGLVATAEIWDPVTEQVTQVATANVNVYRGYHSTALLLPDGRVLVTGGDHDYGGVIPGQNTNAEIFSPPYLFNENGLPATRPTISAAPDVAELGDTIFVGTPDADAILKALWVVPGAVTHAQDWTQRANILDFTATSGGLNIELPANGNEAPPGYYMLFLVNDEGVPSVAEWIRATLPAPGLAGDFNDDGSVDAADYVVWRKGLGTSHSEVDYDDWRANFGVTAGAASTGASTQAAVPEPTSILMISLGGLCLACRSRRELKSIRRALQP